MFGIIYDVGRTSVKKLLDHLHDFIDGLHGADIILRRKDGEQLHIGAEKLNLRRTELAPVHPIAFGALKQWIIDIGDVLYVVDLLSGVQKGAVDKVKRQVCRGMAQVGGVIGRNATHVHGGGIPCDLYGSDGLIRGIVQAQLRRFTGHRAERR